MARADTRAAGVRRRLRCCRGDPGATGPDLIVVDASAALELVAGAGSDRAFAEACVAADGDLHAPELFDVEILNGLRGLEARGSVTAVRAAAAVAHLLRLPIARYPHEPLLERAWELRGSLTAYDAVYVALAELLGATLVTVDRRLARAVDTVTVAAPA